MPTEQTPQPRARTTGAQAALASQIAQETQAALASFDRRLLRVRRLLEPDVQQKLLDAHTVDEILDLL